MTKAQKAVEEFAKPYIEKLEAHLAAGGTREEYAATHPFETGVIYAATSIAIKLL